ncbi:hypothetical protein LZ32DRAFT_153465 [Colletotrichum eremochloae]|nr:hypothetical protein LZ32DRAFT_153465 [Colletotrichum eremochloae]
MVVLHGQGYASKRNRTLLHRYLDHDGICYSADGYDVLSVILGSRSCSTRQLASVKCGKMIWLMMAYDTDGSRASFPHHPTLVRRLLPAIQAVITLSLTRGLLVRLSCHSVCAPHGLLTPSRT